MGRNEYLSRVRRFSPANSWKRNSSPIRRDDSPLQRSSLPRMAKSTPAADPDLIPNGKARSSEIPQLLGQFGNELMDIP